MPLDKDILGMDLYNARNAFNNKTWNELLQEHGSEQGIREAMCKADAEAIINHFKTAGLITVDTTGTATAQHGIGTIS